MNRVSTRALAMASILLVAMIGTASPALADLDAGAGSVLKPIEVTEKEDPSTESEPTYTEDTDTNDGTDNNVSDDGDNAHPSGNDRSVESGGSDTQGNAGSDPDDDGRGPDRSNGGPDKANGSGGVDKDDQDGNNGCGNDDDFEDDNEGWCGKPASVDNDCSENGHNGWECSESGGHMPCAGCVGKADDKNPSGQIVDGSDDNKGYECDENSGIGRTNPAHTGCSVSVAGSIDEVQPEEEVLGAVESRSDAACPAGTDNAGQAMDSEDCDDDDSVLGKVLQRAGPVGAAVKSVGAAVGAVLPFTGNGDLVAFLMIALGSIAGGLLLLKKRKTA